MPTFTLEQLARAQKQIENVRNFSIIANVDAGKSSLSDALLCAGGLISKKDAGIKRQTDTMKMEQDRGITIKSVGVTLCLPYEGVDRIINMIDSPGHNLFASEVDAALRITDGAVVLIDTVEGAKVQTKTVLTQALRERVKPVLVINKIDKLFLSLKLTPEEIYDRFVKNVDDVNQIIGVYQDQYLIQMTRDQQVDPVRGDVVFATAYHTWGFTLRTFAKLFHEKFNKTIEETMKELWQKKNFCRYILQPLYLMLNCCTSHPEISVDGRKLEGLVKKLGINVPKETFELRNRDLMRAIMGTWLPVADSIIEVAIEHLPSPNIAQKYRAELLYKGGRDDKYFESIKNCDPTGPLIVYISKMVPTKDNSHFYAFGRVFSGTITSGKVLILSNDHYPEIRVDEDEKEDVVIKKRGTFTEETVQRVILMMASRMEPIDSVPAGNIVAIDGIDKGMYKSGTVVGANDVACFPLKNVTFTVAPVVQISIKPKKASDIATFKKTIEKFIKSDPCLQYIYNKDTNEHILAGTGALHLEVAIEHLKEFLKGVEIVVSEPTVQYCETITSVSNQECLAKSANKHNRLFAIAEPVDEKLMEMFTHENFPTDHRDRSRWLFREVGLDDPRKVWSLSPEMEPVNLLTNDTSGIQYLNEVKDSICSGFADNCERGPLCDEPVRGVKLVIKDAKFHQDNVHRGDNQILPMTRRLLFSTMLSAEPRLLEPVFKVEISLPIDRVSEIYKLMAQKRGRVESVSEIQTGNTVTVISFLPVSKSFDFMDVLRDETSGEAFASMMFDHWALVPGDPLTEGTEANEVMMNIRKRKGRKIEIPLIGDYLDKL